MWLHATDESEYGCTVTQIQAARHSVPEIWTVTRFRRYIHRVEEHRPADDYSGLPGVGVTADQLVAMNVRFYRRQAGMTQQELGELLGWTKVAVSAAERSVDPGRDRRRFDAATLVALAVAFRLPIAAFFLPPEDDGISKRYLVYPAPGESLSMPEYVAFLDDRPDWEDDRPESAAYARRWTLQLNDPGAAESLAKARVEAARELTREELLSRLGAQRAALAEVIADIDRSVGVIVDSPDIEPGKT